MNLIRPLTCQLFIAAGAWLIFIGFAEITSSSRDRYGNAIAALNSSNGSWKIGIGLICFAGASLGPASKRSFQPEGERSFADSNQREKLAFSNPIRGGNSKKTDFEVCSRLYVQRGGKSKPVYANSSILQSSLILCDENKNALANFEKDLLGEWQCRGFNG